MFNKAAEQRNLCSIRMQGEPEPRSGGIFVRLHQNGRIYTNMNIKMSQLRCFINHSLSLSTKISQLRCF